MHLKNNSALQGGKYRILSLIGQGGFGMTYLAEQVSLGRKVAVKEFFMKEHCNREEDSCVSVPSLGSRELVGKFRQKFLKEAQLIATFRNPHIIGVYDVFEENGTAYYVMEYLEGKSLSALVADGNPMNEADAVRYIRQIASALAEVHSKNLLHLDVKPANVMLNGKGDAVLIDFGISKHYDDEGSQTSSGLVGLSDGYAPMEQYKKGGIASFSPATDIYSLGATFYKLLTGKTPPHSGDVYDDGLPALPAHVSERVRKAVEAAMQPRRRERPQSIAEFLELLGSDGEAAFAVPPVPGDTVMAAGAAAAGGLPPTAPAVLGIGEVSGETVVGHAGVDGKTSVAEPSLAGVGNIKDEPGIPSVPPVTPKPVQPVNGGKNASGNKGALVLMILLLLLAVVGAGVYFIFGGSGSSAPAKGDSADSQSVNEEKKNYQFADMGLEPFVDSDGKWGFADRSGNVVIPCRYDNVKGFSDGVATVAVCGDDGDLKWGVIDGEGTHTVPCKYDYVRWFHSGMAAAKIHGKWGFIDRCGNPLTEFKYERTEECIEGMAHVGLDGKFGFVDSTGREVIPCIYDWSDEGFENGLTRVELNGERFMIDKSGTRCEPKVYAEPAVVEVKEQFVVLDDESEWEETGLPAVEDVSESDIVDVSCSDDVQVEEEVDEEEIFVSVQDPASFPGGIQELYKYLSDNIEYPAVSRENNSQGKTILRFIVNTDGSITSIEVIKSSGDMYLDKEAIRVVSGMPKWKPGMKNGRSVRCYFTLPISFKLQ